DRPLEDSGCRFCGACLDLCPTGALAERRARWSGPAERSVKTICPYCSSNCRIEIDAAGGRILRSRGLDCRLCVLGRFGLDFVHHGRLERPMIRRGGRLVEVGWEEAMDYVAESLEGLGPGRVAMLVSGVLSNEALCAAEILAEPAMGCSPVAPDIATCFSIREIVQGPSLAVGDLAETNPAMELALRSAGPVVVSARRTPLSERASFWIRPQPGEEAAALEALAEASLGKKMRASPDQEEIWRASRTLGGGAVIIGPDCDGDVRRAGGMLAEAVGGRLCLVGRSCNSMGSAALGLHRGYEEALCSLRAGGLRAAYIAGLNPAREDPSLSACLSGLELLVVQDLFLTETAALADAVLPASSFAEIDGTITSSDGRMLQLSPALPTIGRPDAQILSDLCRRLGIRGPEDPSALQAEASRRIQRGISEAHFQADLAAPSRSASERDSYMLIKGPSLFSFGSSTRTSRVHDLRYLADKRRVTIHPQDARDLGIVDGQTVTLETASMGIQARCRISMAVPRGSLYLPGGDGRATGVRVRPNV
ncbi:MAG: molybdopterin-dependent oxidoreductase, partial [Methanothrix sp.]|nr:molybdopterin-dependent oxidoreductase [Methanothrix sp.]